MDAIERALNKSEATCLFGVSLSSMRRYAKMAHEEHPLKLGKASSKHPKLDGRP